MVKRVRQGGLRRKLGSAKGPPSHRPFTLIDTALGAPGVVPYIGAEAEPLSGSALSFRAVRDICTPGLMDCACRGARVRTTSWRGQYHHEGSTRIQWSSPLLSETCFTTVSG